MPSTFAIEGHLGPCLLTTCWAHRASGTPNLPARVGDKDTQALIDTGSVVTLPRHNLAYGRPGEPIEVACVHGDTRSYTTTHREGLPHLPPALDPRAWSPAVPTAKETPRRRA